MTLIIGFTIILILNIIFAWFWNKEIVKNIRLQQKGVILEKDLSLIKNELDDLKYEFENKVEEEIKNRLTSIKEFNYDGKNLDVIFGGNGPKIFGKLVAQYFFDVNAENYVEQQLRCSHKKEEYLITFQKMSGKTPHILRREAEKTLLDLRTEFDNYKKLAERRIKSDDNYANHRLDKGRRKYDK